MNIDGSATYRGAMGATRTVETSAYYLTNFLNESRLNLTGCGLSGLFIIAMFIAPFFS